MKIFNRAGQPITLSEWGTLAQDIDYKVVRQETIDDYLVSTVWLGFDHGFNGEARQIFETMIFPKGSYEDLWADRYATEAEAIQGHEEISQKVKDGTWQNM